MKLDTKGGWMSRLLLVLVTYLAFAVPAVAQVILDGDYPSGGPIDFLTLHAAVSADAADPRSAQYKAIAFPPTPKQATVCGLVNFRNASGGYDPFEAFIYFVSDREVKLLKAREDATLQKLLVSMLERLGCPAPGR